MAWPVGTSIETHPYVVRWHHPTGDRLTRFAETIKVFATEIEALAALQAPFPRNTTDAHCVKFERVGYAPMIAKRKRCKAMARTMARGK